MELSPSREAANCAANQELPSILWHPKVHYRVHKGPPLAPILSQMDSIPTIPSYLSKIHFLTFQEPNLKCIFFRLCRLSKESVQFRGFILAFVTSFFFTARSCYPHAQHPSWRTTPCRLSATAYSIYSQLPSIPGGCVLHPQPEDAPCRGDKGPT
jgi:hypothetical protein